MNVKDLDGNSGVWHLTGNIVKGCIENKSSYHLETRKLLKKIYPTMQVLEEVAISPRKSETLYLDFYIPLIKKCIEVHGEQHYKFIPYYHSNKLAFLKAQKRDKDKEEWCGINGIKYVPLMFNEDLNMWEMKIYE
jgi:hemerythrin-like domain-containing protein